MKEKKFLLPELAINPNLAPHCGACIASESITLDGYPVGFTYRDEPDDEIDSGWRVSLRPRTVGMRQIGSGFERHAKSLKFIPVPFPQFDESEERSRKHNSS